MDLLAHNVHVGDLKPDGLVKEVTVGVDAGQGSREDRHAYVADAGGDGDAENKRAVNISPQNHKRT